MKGVLIFLPLLFAIAFAQDQPEADVNPEWFLGHPHYHHIPPHYYLPHPYFIPRFHHPYLFPHHNFSIPHPFPSPPPTASSTDDSQINPDIDTEEILFPYHGIPFHSHIHPWFHPHPFFPHPHFVPHFPYKHHLPFPFLAQPPSSPSTTTDNEESNDEEMFVFAHPYKLQGENPPVSDDHMTCFLAVHDQKMRSCLNDFHSYLMTHEVAVSPRCCSALNNIEESCHYKNPFLEHLVDQHCAAPSPSN